MKINDIFNLKFQQKFIVIFIIFIFSWAFSAPVVLSSLSIEIESMILFSVIRFISISLILLALIYYIHKSILDEIRAKTEEKNKIQNQQKKLLIALRNNYFFYRHEPDRNFSYISKSIKNILGYTKDEFIQYLDINNITALTESVFERADLFSSDGILIPPIEIELQDRKGDKLLFEITESPVFDKNANLIAVEGIAHNLSSYYHNITDDASFKDKYDILFQDTNDAIFIIKDNKYVDCNHKALEIFGSNYENIIMGSPFSINFSPYKQPNGEISRELALEKIQEAKLHGKNKFNWVHLKEGKTEINTEVTLIYRQYENEEITFAILKEELNHEENKTGKDISDNKVLKEIFNNSRALLYKLNIETKKYEYLSDSVIDIMGYTKEEMLNFSEKELQKLLHPNDLSNAENIIAKLVKEDKSNNTQFSVEYRFLNKKGEYRWFSDSYKIIRNEDNSYIIGNIHDITEMVEYRETLKNSELRFRKTVENIQNGISIFENNKIIYVNDRLTEITGYSKEELMSLNSLKDLAIPQEKERLKNISEKDSIKSIEFWISKKNGEKICIQNKYSESYISDDLYGKYVITADITEQKKLEIALVEREEKFVNLTNRLPQAIFEINENGIISYINKSGSVKLGYSTEELIGKIKLVDITTGEYKDLLIDSFNNILQDEILEHIEIEIINKQGNKIPFRIYPGVIKTDNKNTGIRGIMIDISDESRAKKEIRIAQKTVSSINTLDKSMISDIIKEMSEPVNSISGMINLIKSTKLSEEQYDFLKIISKSSASLSEIIKDINEVAKTNNSSGEEFNLLKLIQEVKEDFTEKLENKEIEFKLKQNFSEHININTGKDKIKLLTNNVLSLSKNMIEKGVIELEVKVEDKTEDTVNLFFNISNDGVKLDEDEVDLINKIILDPKNKDFKYNINDKLKISIINDLLSEFNGKLEFLKGAKGRNIFSYNLNLNFKNTTENSPSKTNLKDIKILLAEDQLFNQMVIKTMARNWDCEIDIVEDGEYAIEKLKTKKYDLILMDIHMPRMDGIETIKHINEELDIDTPIIAITGDIYKKNEDFEEYGISNLIIKPFTSQELFKSIVKALGIYSVELDDNTEISYADNNSLYSLDIINKLAKGNEEIKIKMIRVFVKKTVEELKELKKATKQNKFEKTFAISHKMKPAFGYLKIRNAEALLNDIVENSRNKKNIDKIINLVESLEKEINKTIKQLQVDFKDIL